MSSPETWLRVGIYETRGTDFEASLQYMITNISHFTAALEKQPGFVVAYWGENFDEGTIAAVTHWRSRRAITEAGPALRELRAQAENHGVHLLHAQNLALFTLPPAVTMWPVTEDKA